MLRARLAVDEARAVPYTPEELALFKQPAPPVANPDAEKKSIKELPGGTATLVAEAQHYFAGRQYDKAEDDYLQILRHDENNGLVLANLAAIEIQQNKLDDAEKHIQAALTQAPNDAYNLSLLGYLKFQQTRIAPCLPCRVYMTLRTPAVQERWAETTPVGKVKVQPKTSSVSWPAAVEECAVRAVG